MVLGALVVINLTTGCGGGNGKSPSKVRPGGTTVPTTRPTTAPTTPTNPLSASATAGTYTGNFSLSNGESGTAQLTINADGTASLTTSSAPGAAITATGTYNAQTGLLALRGQIVVNNQTLACTYGGRVTINGSTYTVGNGTISISNGVTGNFNVARPTTVPTTAPTTVPTTVPTTGPTTAPTTAPVTKGPITTFFASGTLSGGQFQQDDGSFFRFNLVPRGPEPTPDPEPEPTLGPTPTPEPFTITFYKGTYVLSNGESGNFTLFDSTSDVASGSPNVAPNLTFAFPPLEQGDATITARVSGSTGSGTVRLSNGVTGNITITSRQVISGRTAALAKQQIMRQAGR